VSFSNMAFLGGAVSLGSLLAVSHAGESAPPIPPGLRASYPTIARRIQVGPDGRVLWEGQPATLYEVIENLHKFHEQHPEPNAGVLIEPQGTKGSTVAWVFDQARTARFKSAWFGPSAVAPASSLPTDPGNSATGKGGLASAPPLTWVRAGEWKDTGKKTPMAAFETILRAGASGNDETLAAAIDLDEYLHYLSEPRGIQLPGAKTWEITPSERQKILMMVRERLDLAAVQFYDAEVQSGRSTVCALGVDAGGLPHFLRFVFSNRNDEWHFGPDFDLNETIYGVPSPPSD